MWRPRAKVCKYGRLWAATGLGATAQLLHQRGIVRQIFAEAEAGIGKQPLSGDARRHTILHPLLQIRAHFGHHIGVVGLLLHGFRQPLHVHQAYPGLRILRQ